MGLVDYSDSGSSSDEAEVPAPAPAPALKATPPAGAVTGAAPSRKTVDRAEPRKIRVDLPSIHSDRGQLQAGADADDVQPPPAKRARLGAGSGFNSFLPAPKRAANAAAGPKPGVSLRTSGEAAFSREAPPAIERRVDEGGEQAGGAVTKVDGEENGQPEKVAADTEVKLFGKATRFRPLSAANNKKKKQLPAAAKKDTAQSGGTDTDRKGSPAAPAVAASSDVVATPLPPKPKKSLFSMHQEEVDSETLPSNPGATTYEPITTETTAAAAVPEFTDLETQPSEHSGPAPNTLQSIAADLNLTPSQKRQLFGRSGGSQPLSAAVATSFDLSAEYAANERARAAGEVQGHRAVKAVAPGKHSLQQLVNNARSQREAMEDKWAEGRRERGEAGGRYGWGQ